MNTEGRVYRDLQKHLDKLPISYPATESGVEIRILEHLFTPQEAEIALQLSIIPEPVGRIHRRVGGLGLSIGELGKTLERMSDKGLIEVREKDGERLYGNAMLAVGMYEYQVERLTKDFARDFLQYLEEGFAEEVAKTKINQLRTIPIEKSIPQEYHIGSYDDIRKIVADVDGPIVVVNCVCRQTKDIAGESCTKTDLRESCLIFNRMAKQYLHWGVARQITKEEALGILEKAQEAGLVLQPQNTQQPEFVCCCCGDCCGILTSVKRFPRPADMYATNYYAEIDPELCNGCEDCIERCQLDALTMVGGVATVDLDRCIGCGNCVVICGSGASRLRQKEAEVLPPKDTDALYTKIMVRKVGKWNMLKMGVKMLLRLRV
jgi:electron transport complex protein RnfB